MNFLHIPPHPTPNYSTLKELINQGRQKVLEATSALKSLPREPLEDIIGQLVSNREGRGQNSYC